MLLDGYFGIVVALAVPMLQAVEGTQVVGRSLAVEGEFPFLHLVSLM
jgi:hypothetical protein